MNVAIIPARGGSKRIPRKNIKYFCDKPIIAYSIENAIKSNLFDKVIVSTDDFEIAEIAKQFGADVPFFRSNLLSDDFSTTHDVMTETITKLKQNGKTLEYACCLYATAPLVLVKDLKTGFELLKNKGFDLVLAASKFDSSIFRSFKLNSIGGLEMIYPEHYFSRSQDLPTVYHDAGQFYWAKAEYWLGKQEKFNSKMSIVEIPSWRTQDIDTESDWIRAETIFANLKAIKLL